MRKVLVIVVVITLIVSLLGTGLLVLFTSTSSPSVAPAAVSDVSGESTN